MSKEELLSRIKKEIKVALKEFGAYSFRDKGAGEVMDLGPLITELKALPIADCREVLSSLAKGTEFESHFVNDALMDMQDIPDADFEFLMQEPELQEAF